MTYQKAITSKCLLKHPHGSRLEADYCNWLLEREQTGQIPGFLWQFSFPITKTKRWKSDFVVVDQKYAVRAAIVISNILETHEAKGMNPADDNFTIKINHFFRMYPHIPVFVNKRRYGASASCQARDFPTKHKKQWPKRTFAMLRERKKRHA